jgi:hypothetical protein
VASAYKIFARPSPTGGIVQNQAQDTLDDKSWLTADNVVFRNGTIRKAPGWTIKATGVSGAVSLIRNVRYRSGTLATLIGTADSLYRYVNDLPELLNATSFHMAPTDRWEADYLYKKWYFTNQSDGLVYWDGINNITAVPVLTDRGRSVCQFQNHIIISNLASTDTTGAYSFLGSSLLNLEGAIDFDTAIEDSDALLRQVPDNAEPIQRIARLSNIMAIYKANSIHNLSYNAGISVYSQQLRISHMGVLAPHSLADIGDQHLFLAQDNLYAYNASTLKAFGDRVWLWWISQVKASMRGLVWATHDFRNHEVIFAYQENDVSEGVPGNLRALVYNYMYDSFSSRDWPFSGAGLTQIQPAGSGDEPTFDELTSPMDEMGVIGSGGAGESAVDFGLLAGDAGGNLYAFDDEAAMTDSGKNGTAMEAVLETGDTDHGDPFSNKIVNGMLVDISGQTGTAMQVWVAPRWTLDDAITYSGPYVVSSRGFAPFMHTGRYFRYKFVKPDGLFTLRSYAPSVQLRGSNVLAPG